MSTWRKKKQQPRPGEPSEEIVWSTFHPEGKKMKRKDEKPSKVQWMGKVHVTCDLCQRAIADEFYDVKFGNYGWGCACPQCFQIQDDLQLGTGLGQHYKAETTRHHGDEHIRFIKIGG